MVFVPDFVALSWASLNLPYANLMGCVDLVFATNLHCLLDVTHYEGSRLLTTRSDSGEWFSYPALTLKKALAFISRGTHCSNVACGR